MEDAHRQLVVAASRRLGLSRPAVTPLTGGSRNRCFRLVEGTHDVVLRILARDDEVYDVERDAELLAQRLAAAHGLAPALLLEDRAAGYTVSEYLPGPVWSRERAASPAGAAQLGDWLARLHALDPPPGMRRVRFDELLQSYCDRLGPGPVASQLVGMARRQAPVPDGYGIAVLCHHDLHHLNLVDAAQRLMVIDWEYAGLGQPVMDLAGYVAYHELAAPAVQALLSAYGRTRPCPDRAALATARWRFEAVWWAWLELMRRAEGAHAADLAGTQRRLERRLLQPQSAS
jgi:Ser/Thr protein kinase RdoA (MazF antagonist)